MAKRGRPTKFTQEIADEVCRRIAEGQSLRAICEDDHIPSLGTVLGWVRHPDYTAFFDQYVRAREAQAHLIEDEILSIADDASRDFVKKEDGTEVVDNEAIARARLRVDTRKWLLGKLSSKRFGDKVEVSGDPDKPIKISFKE